MFDSIPTAAEVASVTPSAQQREAAEALLAAAQATARARELAERAGLGTIVRDSLVDAHASVKYAIDTVAGRQ